MRIDQKVNQMMRLIVLSAVLSGLVAGAATAVSAPDWAVVAEQPLTFGNEQPGINRPVVGAWTNYYTYGVAPFGSSPEFYATIEPGQYDQPVNMYMILENRVSGAAMYYNLSRGWVNSETDLFSAPGGDPVAVLPPDLDSVQLWGPNGAFGAYDGPTATGQYQFMVELRAAGTAGVVARDNAMYSFVDAALPLQGNIANQTLTANNTYVLVGPTVVTGNLTIQPGTFVLCTPDSDTVLAIQQGATINASGTNKRPIVISSVNEWQDRAKGDCGGVAVNGFGTINTPTGSALGEGDSGSYGGNNPQDSSGTIRYVRIEFAGVLFSQQNELNGLALQGTGSGTTVEYVQVSYGLDDGLENFGGNHDTRYIILYNNDDDSYDATEGWSGSAMNTCVIQTVASSDKGFEIDGNAGDVNALPATLGIFNGFTIVMTGSDQAMVFRVGSRYNLTNGVIINAPGEVAMTLGDSDVPADPTPTFPGTANGVVNNVVFQGGAGAGADPAIVSANVRMEDGARSLTKPRILIRSGSAGGQGCATRNDPWPYAEWTEYQPGLPQ